VRRGSAPGLATVAALALAIVLAAAPGCLEAAAAPPAAAPSTSAAAAAKTISPAATPSAPSAAAAAGADTLAHGLFSDIRIVRPAGGVRQFAMLLTDDTTTSAHERRLVEQLAAAGAMVAIVPLASFWPRLEAQSGKCTYSAGAFENLSRHLQAYEHLPTYSAPLLVGADDNAALVYALLAQAPAGIFAGGLADGFCPRMTAHLPPCAANALRWKPSARAGSIDLLPPSAASAPGAAWIALPEQGRPTCSAEAARSFTLQVPRAEWLVASDADTGFERAWGKLAPHQTALAPPPAQLADLPIVEVPAAEGAHPSRLFAVLLSGDGGWAGIDKSLGAAFAAQGIPVAGFDSLRYFWSARTPEGLAADLDRVIRYYAARWGRDQALLVGYSQGADVLPFALNRLPPATRASVRLTALLGPGQKASFEFHVANWLGPSGDLPIAPEAHKLAADETLCLYGQDEKDSLCPELAPAHARPLPLAGGHHFGGDYDALAARILAAVPR
jgi:type IV secretory pathway VirJ component